MASYALLPASIAAAIHLVRSLGPWPARLRRLAAGIALPACALLFVTDAAYFAEYDAQFDPWVFGLVTDDKSAIAATIWKTYPVVGLTLLALALAGAMVFGAERVTRRAARGLPVPALLQRRWSRGLGAALLVALTLFGLRGSLGRRPVQEKDLATTGDAFLNKLVENPFFALFTAIQSQRKLETDAGVRVFLPDGDVKRAARALFAAPEQPPDLDAALQRSASGAGEPRAQHVFVVVMESYDSWSMQPKFSSLHLTDRLAALGRAGIQARAFVSAGSGTIKSLGAIMTGLPATGLYVNYLPGLRRGVPTSAPAIFRRLGYRTRFFYGGYLSWQRIGDFARDLGFDEVHGGDEMSAQLTGNEWGVDDDAMFRFVVTHTGDEPTFDVIMSTSYHPPFSVDLEAKGFDVGSLRENPLCSGLSSAQLRVLGHLWYSDQSLGDFVRDAEQKLPRSLFALTGDHYSREQSVDPRPTLFESNAVPLVLYGPEVLARVHPPAGLAGAHIDILPTLVGLVAPAGFSYPAFGRDLLDASQPQVGFGNDVVITPAYVFPLAAPERIEDLEGRPFRDPVPVDSLALRYRRSQGLAWWRAMRGASWPD
ncbi:MAG: LTA synthase family protein [Myxococcota bacterium]